MGIGTESVGKQGRENMEIICENMGGNSGKNRVLGHGN